MCAMGDAANVGGVEWVKAHGVTLWLPWMSGSPGFRDSRCTKKSHGHPRCADVRDFLGA